MIPKQLTFRLSSALGMDQLRSLIGAHRSRHDVAPDHVPVAIICRLAWHHIQYAARIAASGKLCCSGQ
ncbi:hypothetical protein GUH73_12025 [Xanthomonas citri pv. citri]|nr:hypothetical protein [Xanthomonas citri]MBD4093377.1 hypothetical protein [Xanthomonas citri pv. citri]